MQTATGRHRAPRLTCTCPPGGPGVEGTMQETIEARLAPLTELTIPDVHALLDLMDNVLDEVLDLPDDSLADDETARRMAQKSGRTTGWVHNFLTTWEFITDEVDRERYAAVQAARGKDTP